MRRKILQILLLVVVAALTIGFVSCGDSEFVDPELPEGYVLDPSGKIKVNTYLRTGADSETVLDKWIREYNSRFPNVTVKPEIIAWGDFGVKIAAGDIGDVYYTAECDVYNYAIKNRAAMALDAYIDAMEIDISNIYTGLYELGCAKGSLYMCPSDLSQNVLYTNVTALKEAGLQRPENDWTWADLREYCQKLRKTNEDGNYTQVGLGWSQTFGNAHIFLTGWGGEWLDVVNKKVHLASDEKVVAGYAEMRDMVDKGYMNVGGLTGEMGVKYSTLPDTIGCVFTLGTWVNRVGLHDQYEQLGCTMDVTAHPAAPVQRVINGGATGFMAYSKTKNPDAAASFTLLLLTDEGQEAFNGSVGGGIPITKNNIEKGSWKIPYPEEEFNYSAFVCYPEAFCASWAQCFVPPEIATILTKYLDTIMTQDFSNQRSYTDTLQACEQEVNEKWATIFEG